ncbi:mitochondrial inner membrane protease subunit 2-like isoform X1 [Leptotrombidium deliense]|uniref:Mitochondrial inner membrane protease subunit 2-like isoform X1 n=1 Tax=Leptotrombidium deliense TaxID=299467 RepID=A0A443SWM9_9ACAR|nr:mitochondrial inner membrane protease subunit 2-like isoform X1 [Leptotrombidium deliense]
MLMHVLKQTALNLPIVLFVTKNVGSFAKVDGDSMIPTLNPGGKKGKSDYVFLWKWSMREFDISRGQVVALM